jgi:hypothetical protein
MMLIHVCHVTSYKIHTGLRRSTMIFMVCKWLAYFNMPAAKILHFGKIYTVELGYNVIKGT